MGLPESFDRQCIYTYLNGKIAPIRARCGFDEGLGCHTFENSISERQGPTEKPYLESVQHFILESGGNGVRRTFIRPENILDTES